MQLPGWQGSDRRQRLPSNWQSEIRPRILNRDRYRCQHIRFDTGEPCNLYANEVDHISRGDDHRDANLQALCHYHHLQKSGSEGGAASQAARNARYGRPGKAKHPGLLD